MSVLDQEDRVHPPTKRVSVSTITKMARQMVVMVDVAAMSYFVSTQV